MITAADGEQAIAAIRREPDLDLLITDIFMPRMEGIETIQAARALCPDLRIVAISGAFGGQYLSAAERLGVDAVLLKPIRLETLRQTVSALWSDPAAAHDQLA